MVVPWSDVAQVTVLKCDLYAVDEIIMLLQCDGQPTALQLSEHAQGYEAFARALSGALPTSTPYSEWFMQVAFPAFATNELCIYRRANDIPKCVSTVAD